MSRGCHSSDPGPFPSSGMLLRFCVYGWLLGFLGGSKPDLAGSGANWNGGNSGCLSQTFIPCGGVNGQAELLTSCSSSPFVFVFVFAKLLFSKQGRSIGPHAQRTLCFLLAAGESLSGKETCQLWPRSGTHAPMHIPIATRSCLPTPIGKWRALSTNTSLPWKRNV